MKALIFAGGVGTRLWPLSRKKSPKQFEKIIDNKSTLQLTVERILPEFKPEDIFISTGEPYVKLVALQLPKLPKENIIGEPYKKDVGPAVAFACGYIAKRFGNHEPIVILWSDHIVKKEKKFLQILRCAKKVIAKEQNKIIFIGQKPRFASDNLGWIEFGGLIKKEAGVALYKFVDFRYKPTKLLAEKYFKSRRHCWNLGYFVTTPKFILDAFRKTEPAMAESVHEIVSTIGTDAFRATLVRYYGNMPSINFDHAILEKLDKKHAYVIVEDIGWSDVGAWEALKEALEEKRTDNITHGNVLLEDSVDNLVYNYEEKKLVVGIDLADLLVVNTEDILMVAKKSSVSKIKKVVEGFQGTKNERLT